MTSIHRLLRWIASSLLFPIQPHRLLRWIVDNGLSTSELIQSKPRLLQGGFFPARQRRPEYAQEENDGPKVDPKELGIVIHIKHTGELANASQILAYGKSIIEKHIRTKHPKSSAVK